MHPLQFGWAAADTASSQATSVLIDPLTSAQPSEETGLNSHFTRSPASPRHSPAESISNNPFRNNRNSIGDESAFTHVRQTSRGSLGSPSAPSSPKGAKSARVHEQAVGVFDAEPSLRKSLDGSSPANANGHRRNSSLKARFPGDDSLAPLDMMRRDSKKANRASHLKKQHIPGPDIIDRLDPTINNIAYHHEGPYDAALRARNADVKASPIAALKESNNEAIKATPPENIRDALQSHRPMDGTAVLPPGVPDKLGRKLSYVEGENERYEGAQGNGDYSSHRRNGSDASLDRALEHHTINDRDVDAQGAMEMSNRANAGRSDRKTMTAQNPFEVHEDGQEHGVPEYIGDNDAHASASKHKGGLKEGLKRRIGSIRHRHHDEQ